MAGGRDRSSLIPNKVEVWFPAVACPTTACPSPDAPPNDFFVVTIDIGDALSGVDYEDAGFDGSYVVHDTAIADYGCGPGGSTPPPIPCNYCTDPAYPIFDAATAQCCTTDDPATRVCTGVIVPPGCSAPVPTDCDPCHQASTFPYTVFDPTTNKCCQAMNLPQCINAPAPPPGCPGGGGGGNPPPPPTPDPPPFDCTQTCNTDSGMCVFDACQDWICTPQIGNPDGTCIDPAIGMLPFCECPHGTAVRPLNFPPFFTCVPANCPSSFSKSLNPDAPTGPSNEDALKALALQIAKDYYHWRELAFDEVYHGIVDYLGDGVTDWVEYHMTADDAWTRASTGPTNIDPEEMQHHGASDCGDITLCDEPVVRSGKKRCLTRYKITLEDGRLAREKIGAGCCVTTCCSSSSSQTSCCDSLRIRCDPQCFPYPDLAPKVFYLNTDNVTSGAPPIRCHCETENVKNLPMRNFGGCHWGGQNGNSSFEAIWEDNRWNLHVTTSGACDDGGATGGLYSTVPPPNPGPGGSHLCCNEGPHFAYVYHDQCSLIPFPGFTGVLLTSCKCHVCDNTDGGGGTDTGHPDCPPGYGWDSIKMQCCQTGGAHLCIPNTNFG